MYKFKCKLFKIIAFLLIVFILVNNVIALDINNGIHFLINGATANAAFTNLNTKSLIHFDGANESTTFIDESGKTITPYRNAQLSSAQSKFGDTSGYFDGSSYITIPYSSDWVIHPNESFTIDMWTNFSSLANTYFINNGNGTLWSEGSWFIGIVNKKLVFKVCNSTGWALDLAGTTILSANTQYHIAVVKDVNNVTIYLNGIAEATGVFTGSSFDLSKPLYIGADITTSLYLTGYIDEFRFSKGIARWTSNFTPPTTSYNYYDFDNSNSEALSGIDDIYTKSLIHFDVTSGATTFIDESGKTITPYRNAQLSSAQSKFGDTSGYFDGSSYITIPYSSDWVIHPNESFTIDMWTNFSSLANTYFINNGNGTLWSEGSWFIGIVNKKLVFKVCNSTGWALDLAGTTILSANTQYHIAVVKDVNNVTIYLNGIAEATGVFTGSSFDLSKPLYIGADITTSQYLTGYIDEFRFSKGIARWTSNFTPPITSYKGEIQNQALLIQIDGDPHNDMIQKPGEIDYYKFTIPQGAEPYPVTIESSGNNDMFGKLYDSKGNLIQKDDDTGVDTNFLISQKLEPGKTYYISVEHLDSYTGIGEYSLAIKNKYYDPDAVYLSDIIQELDGSYTYLGNGEFDVTVDGVAKIIGEEAIYQSYDEWFVYLDKFLDYFMVEETQESLVSPSGYLKSLSANSPLSEYINNNSRSTENVRRIQKVLIALSCWYNTNGTKSTAKATGYYGSITKNSITLFQQKYMRWHKPNGILDANTASELSKYGTIINIVGLQSNFVKESGVLVRSYLYCAYNIQSEDITLSNNTIAIKGMHTITAPKADLNYVGNNRLEYAKICDIDSAIDQILDGKPIVNIFKDGKPVTYTEIEEGQEIEVKAKCYGASAIDINISDNQGTLVKSFKDSGELASINFIPTYASTYPIYAVTNSYKASTPINLTVKEGYIWALKSYYSSLNTGYSSFESWLVDTYNENDNVKPTPFKYYFDNVFQKDSRYLTYIDWIKLFEYIYEGTGNSGVRKFTIDFDNKVYHYSADTRIDRFMLNTLLLDNAVYLEQRENVTDEPLYVLENYYAHNGPVWEYILACWLKDVRLKYENNGYTFEEYISISNVIRDMIKCTTNGRGALLSEYYDPNSNSALQVIYMRLNLSDEAYENGLTLYQTSLLAAAIDGRTYGYIERVTSNIDTLSIFAIMFLGEIESVVKTLTSASANATSREILLKQMQKYDKAVLELERSSILNETSTLIKTVSEAIETAISRVKAIGITDEAALAKISDNVASAVSKGSKFTEATLPKGGVPRGVYGVPTGDAATIRSITRQNETADLLAREGYDIEMLPYKVEGNGQGLIPSANPDYKILGEVFDCYSPNTSNVRNIWTTVKEKTLSQGRRIVLNLDDFTGSMDDLAKQFADWPIDTLDELLAIKDGKIARLVIK